MQKKGMIKHICDSARKVMRLARGAAETIDGLENADASDAFDCHLTNISSIVDAVCWDGSCESQFSNLLDGSIIAGDDLKAKEEMRTTIKIAAEFGRGHENSRLLKALRTLGRERMSDDSAWAEFISDQKREMDDATTEQKAKYFRRGPHPLSSPLAAFHESAPVLYSSEAVNGAAGSSNSSEALLQSLSSPPASDCILSRAQCNVWPLSGLAGMECELHIEGDLVCSTFGTGWKQRSPGTSRPNL